MRREIVTRRPAPEPLREQTWREQAACVGETSLVWVTHPQRMDPAERERAKGVCAGCPVALQCHIHHAKEVTFEGFAAGRGWVVRMPHMANDAGADVETLDRPWVCINGGYTATCRQCGRERLVRPDRGPVNALCHRCRGGQRVQCECGQVVSVLGMTNHRRAKHPEAS